MGWYALGAVAAVALVLAILTPVRYLGPNRRDDALLKAQKIHAAARSFHDRTGTYPPSQDVLATTTEHGPALLEGGMDATTDPWGSRYHFEINADESGKERLVVWTTAPDGTVIRWPRE